MLGVASLGKPTPDEVLSNSQEGKSCAVDTTAHYVYIVECADGSFYTGWTVDVTRRVSVHNRGQGAKYTRGRLPVTLRFVEACSSKSDALRREWEIKRMTRQEKQRLVDASNSIQSP